MHQDDEMKHTLLLVFLGPQDAWLANHYLKQVVEVFSVTTTGYFWMHSDNRCRFIDFMLNNEFFSYTANILPTILLPLCNENHNRPSFQPDTLNKATTWMQNRITWKNYSGLQSGAWQVETCHIWVTTLPKYMDNIILATNSIRHGAFIFIKEKYSFIKTKMTVLQRVIHASAIHSKMIYNTKHTTDAHKQYFIWSRALHLHFSWPHSSCCLPHKPEPGPNQSGNTIREHRMVHN